MLQASEKAWGAVSHYVNFVARLQGWPLGSHRDLMRNANDLISRDPTNAEHRRRLLRSIEALHANFYQAFLDEASVREGIEDARELIRALTDLGADTSGWSDQVACRGAVRIDPRAGMDKRGPRDGTHHVVVRDPFATANVEGGSGAGRGLYLEGRSLHAFQVVAEHAGSGGWRRSRGRRHRRDRRRRTHRPPRGGRVRREESPLWQQSLAPAPVLPALL